jgi:hypothetical protein
MPDWELRADDPPGVRSTRVGISTPIADEAGRVASPGAALPEDCLIAVANLSCNMSAVQFDLNVV